MKSKTLLTAGASALALASLFLVATGASAHPIYRPFHHGMAPIDPNLPVPHVGPHTGPYKAPVGSISGNWKDLATLPFSNGPWNARMQTDGTVLVLDYCTSPGQWWKLTPNKKGKYENGKWTKIAVMTYSPLFFASQTLPDGRMIVNGGEYDNCNGVWSTKGGLYDPAGNSWTSVSPPSGWSTIGDAQSVMLPDGSYMLADCCAAKQAIASINGTNVTWTAGTSYGDNDEEAWTMLPDGDVLTVDVWNLPGSKDDYEIYNTAKGTWSLQGQTPDLLTTTSYRELGPAPLTPQGPKGGTVFQYGANPTGGYNDIYAVASNSWTSGPIMKVGSTIYDCADSPAVTLPDGNALVQASPGTFSTPSHFWEWSIDKTGATTILQVNDPATAPQTSSYMGTFVMLPTGQALWDNSQASPNEVATYTPKGRPKSGWRPVVSSVNSSLKVGSTGNAISGTNFNGFSLGGVYGDDGQMSTNYPIVSFTNNTTGDVCYAKSYNFSTMGVWTQGTTNAVFDIPKKCETGASTLKAIVNGIASVGTSVTLN